MAKYKCVKFLVLEEVDGDGFFIDNKHFVVEVGSIWEKNEEKYRFIGARDSIRLESENGRWMEIYQDDLDSYFEKVKEGLT